MDKYTKIGIDQMAMNRQRMKRVGEDKRCSRISTVQKERKHI